MAQAAPHLEVHTIARDRLAGAPKDVQWHLLDLSDRPALDAALTNIAPDAVIHAAALANIDYCEAHRDEARNVNVGVTQTVADYCRTSGAKLVYTSTDNIYDGEKGRYTETDPPHPVNYYGETKLEAEACVGALESPWTAARVSLVTGLPVIGEGNSFLSRMMSVLERGEELGVPDGEIRSPIDVITLGSALLELAFNDYNGAIQLGGNDILNRHAMAERIAAALGHDPSKVVVNNPESIPGRAPRPRDASLDNRHARETLQTRFTGVEDGLERVLAARKGQYPEFPASPSD